MKKIKKIFFCALICVSFLGIGECQAQSPAQKFETLRTEYRTKKAQGYDVSEAEALFPELRQAIQRKDAERARELLDVLEHKLANVPVSKSGAAEVAMAPPPAKGDMSSLFDRLRKFGRIKRDTPFVFGDEYANPGLASYYKSLGTTFTRIPELGWDRVEPNAPKNGKHNYDFSLLDIFILAYQENGYQDFHMVVKPNAEWACDIPPTGCVRAAAPPGYPIKKEHEKDLYDFIYNLVERYDNDGENDMPGLLRPVTYYEIMSEAQHTAQFCVGSASRVNEYKKILKICHSALKAANPEAKIVLAGLTMEQVFRGFPSKEESSRRMDCMGQWLKDFPNQVKFIKEVVQLTDYYDIVEIHYLDDMFQVYGFMQWLRDDLKIKKPIWIGDAFPIQSVLPDKHSCAPVEFSLGRQIFSGVDSVATRKYSSRGAVTLEDNTIDEWYRQEHATSLVKRVVFATHSGFEGIMMGNTYDWIAWRSSPHLTDTAWMGLVEVNDARINIHNYKKFRVLAKRPAFVAYQTLIKKINGFTEVDRVDIKDGVFMYEYVVNGERKFVMWTEDLVNDCPICESTEDATATVDISSILAKSEVKVTHLVTSTDQASPKTETLSSEKLALTEAPIIVE